MKSFTQLSLSALFCFSALASGQANAQLNIQSCNAEQLKNRIQYSYNVKYKNVPYGQKRVVALNFVAQLKSQQMINLRAGIDDRNIRNPYGFDTEVHNMIVDTFLDRNFIAVLVERSSCNVIQTLLIDSQRRD